MSSLRLFVLTPYFAASESAAPAKARCADLGFVSQFRPYRDFKGGGCPDGAHVLFVFWQISSVMGRPLRPDLQHLFPPYETECKQNKKIPGGKTY